MAMFPFRKCMAGVAVTPVIDSPSAVVTTSRPSTVTRRITDLRPISALARSAIRRTSRAGPRSGSREPAQGRWWGPSAVGAPGRRGGGAEGEERGDGGDRGTA